MKIAYGDSNVTGGSPAGGSGVGAGRVGSRAVGSAALVVLVLLGVAVEGARQGYTDKDVYVTPLLAMAIAYTITGCGVCMAAEPARSIVGWLMLATGVSAAVWVAAASWDAGSAPLQWLAGWARWVPYAFAAVGVAWFTQASRRTCRIVTWTLAFVVFVPAVALLVDQTLIFVGPRFDMTEDISMFVYLISLFVQPMTPAALVLCAVLVVVPRRGLTARMRRRRRWRSAGAVTLALAIALEFRSLAGWPVFVVAAVCLAMSEHGLKDPLSATQTALNRMVYGKRDEPYTVVTRLGAVLESTLEPRGVLPLVTEVIARSLRVPYVAVELTESGAAAIVASCGAAREGTEAFEMVAHGERVGRLLVAPRPGDDAFTERECRLLRDVARQAAIAAQATRLVRDLEDSRERLIAVREEERRRLRRDLHDGLGPSLAGLAMRAHAARKQLARPDRAAQLLEYLVADLGACTIDLRRLVDNLGPAILDAGLAAALRAECDRFNGPHLTVDLTIEGRTDALPAATELAAFRVVCEALTNVTKHAHAARSTVRVTCSDHLRIEVSDDGVGMAPVIEPGVGLASIRERVTELGGVCIIGPAAPRGTTLLVQFPLPALPAPRARVCEAALPSEVVEASA